MVGDPNWLYTTIAQASAAIVAIVGGFITATMLMLTSEKRSLTHQFNEKAARVNALVEEGKTLTKLREKMLVNQFLDSIMYDLKKEGELPPIKELLERHSYLKDLDYETLKQEYETLTKKRIEAKQFIREHSDKIDVTKSIPFIDWIRENKLDVSSYNLQLLAEEYDKYRAHEIEIREAEKSETMPFPFSGIWGKGFGLWPTPIEQQHKLYERQKEDRRIEEIERRISDIRQEKRLHARETINLDSRLKAFTYPPNLKWGIAVLGYLAVSIFVPVRMIAVEAYSASTKQLVIGLFFSGLSAIFVYMAYQIYTLRRR